ncbi:hypothetical protein L1049_020756 [Liquidambar formosana]|uniref:Uncharacterized protein n=1 Tax=Liquidambar formosana TaxID=63359 RepID=A0AAP0S8D5_LIQFO
MSDFKGSTSTITDIRALHKELDEASCPICMDHPHNAVLILCSSHDKGCRSYICDTSYRHSNCLDRFKKLKVNLRNSMQHNSASLPRNPDSLRLGQLPLNVHTSEVNSDLRIRNELAEAHESLVESDHQEPFEHIGNQGIGIVETSGSESFQETNALEESRSGNLLSREQNLKCPLCRGTVQDWEIVKEARQYLDLKRRSCSQESCSFIGNYGELRRHARRVHPTTRPSDIDPSRQRAWQRLEHQREYGDIVSAIRSAMPGAIVLGDYVIDNGDAFNGESSELGEGSGPWWTTLFLFQMISSSSSPRRPLAQPRGLSRVWTRHRRSSGGISSRRNLLGLQDQEEDWNISGDRGDDVSPRPRRRRRFTRSGPGEDQR